MNFKKFLLNKGVIGALIIVLFYGLLMVGIYFSGYKAVPSKIDQLPVAVVSQDKDSTKLAHQLEDALPFKHIKKNLSLSEAKAQLNDRKIYLIINVPKNFNANLKKIDGKSTAKLKFYINYANPTTAVSAMETVSKSVGAKVQKNVLLQQGKGVLSAATLSQLETETKTLIAANPTQKDAILAKAKATQQAATTKINQTYANVAKSYQYDIVKVNKVPTGMQHSMAPFFMSLSFYIGSMIAAMLIVMAYKSFAPLIGRWRSYVYTEIAIVMIAMFAPLLIVGLSKSMIHFSTNVYWQLWFSHTLELFAALNVNLIFSLILGQLGIMINMPFMLTQVVSGAGLIPRPILPGFFKAMSNISPCFYAIRADYNILYGGNHTGTLWLQLFAIGIVTIVIHLIIVAFQKNKNPLVDVA
ncbi:ABC transporter [Leuconostoc pseudomesenteroides]|uniref:YhgE/Pip domain-containing protein n=1 Tax=Leuconostoc pseudomesenteroides TaxID=33968 RepID=UPI0021A9E3C7|nr:ABC transporter permease [Leuconostoc pseudomesenteroides]MCT4387625.1 ABC transporter [Leuconostoc pseudomesenteroides]